MYIIIIILYLYFCDSIEFPFIFKLNSFIFSGANPPLVSILIGVGISIVFFIFLIIITRVWRFYRRRYLVRIIQERISESTFDSSIPLQHTENQCMICVYEFEDGEMLQSLPCGHAFHKKCLPQYLLKMTLTCPICRAKIWDILMSYFIFNINVKEFILR